MKRLALLLFLLCIFIDVNAQEFTNGFDFTLPPFDSTTQEFLPHFQKKTISEFIKTSPKGNFKSGDKIIRFWGVNLTTGACFPAKSIAQKIAARMRKMGINLVRFHHMDNPWTSSEGSLFLQNGSTTELNPNTLDRLYYFLAQLKKEGIYADINLHVSRTFTENDGILYADSILSFAKGVTFFDSQLINLQKEYAKQLLTTKNPYTNLSIADDPVMAVLEITNENTLYGFWKDNQLQPFSEGGGILSRHSDTLDLKWNIFLKDKYGTQTKIKNAWGNSNNDSATEMIIDGGFESGDINQNWSLELHETAKAEMSISNENPYEGNNCAKIEVNQVTNTDWHIQFEQNGASVQKDSVYTVTFYAKSATPTTVYASVIRNADPWTWYGGSEAALTSEWQKYSFSFAAPESNSGLTRFAFLLGNKAGTYWIDNISMKLSSKVGLEDDEDLAVGNIRRIKYSERLGFQPQRVADMAEFYLKLQKDYYDDMYSYLKEKLGVKIPITGSNALGGIYEPFVQSSLDYIDDHAYWDHPRFPNQPWSAWDWFINNKPMVNDDYLGTIPHLFGGLQVQGKPYTISEYNHPFPNSYQVEMLPILTAYGSFHGADGFMFFEYNGGDPADWETDIQNNFFGLIKNTPVMAMFPLFSYAFQNGLIQEDQSPVLTEYSKEYLYNMPQIDDNHRWSKYYPYDRNIALTNSVRIAGFDFDKEKIEVPTVGNTPFTSNTGEVIFSSNHNLVKIQTPLFESIAGDLKSAELFAGKQFQVKKGENNGTIAWLSLSNRPLSLSKKSVIAISSRIQNQNMLWDGNTTVHDNWGNAPTEVQALDLEILLNIVADSIMVYPLDSTGKKMEGFSVLPEFKDHFLVKFNQNELNSLWFGIETFKNSTSIEGVKYSEDIVIYPNPVKRDGKVFITDSEGICNYKLYDLFGREIARGSFKNTIDLKGIDSGEYFLKCSSGQRTKIEKLIIE